MKKAYAFANDDLRHRAAVTNQSLDIVSDANKLIFQLLDLADIIKQAVDRQEEKFPIEYSVLNKADIECRQRRAGLVQAGFRIMHILPPNERSGQPAVVLAALNDTLAELNQAEETLKTALQTWNEIHPTAI